MRVIGLLVAVGVIGGACAARTVELAFDSVPLGILTACTIGWLTALVIVRTKAWKEL